MPRDGDQEWQSTVLQQPVGLDPQYCSNRQMKLDIRKNWSFSGPDYTVKDQDGKVLLRSHGRRLHRTDSITISGIVDSSHRQIFTCIRNYPDATFEISRPCTKTDTDTRRDYEKVMTVSFMSTYRGSGERAGVGSRTCFKDHLTGVNKEIMVDWQGIMKKRGVITLRDDTGHVGMNQEKFGSGVVIGSLGDYDTVFNSTHPQVELIANIDYALLAVSAICGENVIG